MYIKVLSFDGYFQETVNERREESYRVRQCKVLFYLEDDGIQVIEPRIRNSGLPQGTLIKRHRIAKPPPNDHLFYTVHDFNVGMDLELYGRKIRLVACDKFTENFLRKLGVRVNEPEPIPEDPYTSLRLGVSESMQPKRPYEPVDKLRKFLDHDRHVLRFNCFWDDTESLYGDAREMILHYFLADDTIEIREVVQPNAGRDSASCFLRRQKLPKGVVDMPLPGAVTDKTLLNVSATAPDNRVYLVDSLKMGTLKTDYYTDRELTLGATINVYGRKFLICDCDAFTREYYKNKYGIMSFTPVPPPRTACPQPPLNKNPPYNGWGSDEDSLANCKGLIPKPPPKDFVKFMEKDKVGLESHVLRFAARIVTDLPQDRDRCFIIYCFLTDDTFLIYEPPVRNSGFKGGKFMERRKVMKPGQERFRINLPDYYTTVDVYVGAVVEFNNFLFEVCGADEYAYRYMEQHPAEFPFSDVPRIMSKLRPLMQGREEEMNNFVKELDPEGAKSMPYADFEKLIQKLLSDPRYDRVCIVAHEIATLARNYAERIPTKKNYMAIIGLAQQQLRKAPFENFQALLDACRYEDVNKTGSMSQTDLRRICRANHLPLPDDMLYTLMEVSKNFDNGLVYYESFISQLNWRCNPVPPGTVPCDYSGNLEVDWFTVVTGKGSKTAGSCKKVLTCLGAERVCYTKFLTDLMNAGQCK
ncbi:unnamed protein product [Schistocephalus solidus]|uniref:EF-hand domain-containing family member C2 n=1 Tax=Schistocephalus solidus TaxID=70667 RepID=A0A183T5R2_SCHSO|nr:unnamed protein product [Schistocephalus solidus]